MSGSSPSDAGAAPETDPEARAGLLSPGKSQEQEQRARRVKAGSVYEKYLNIKQASGGGMQEITNSTGTRAGARRSATQRGSMWCIVLMSL